VALPHHGDYDGQGSGLTRGLDFPKVSSGKCGTRTTRPSRSPVPEHHAEQRRRFDAGKESISFNKDTIFCVLVQRFHCFWLDLDLTLFLKAYFGPVGNLVLVFAKPKGAI